MVIGLIGPSVVMLLITTVVTDVVLIPCWIALFARVLPFGRAFLGEALSLFGPEVLQRCHPGKVPQMTYCVLIKVVRQVHQQVSSFRLLQLHDQVWMQLGKGAQGLVGSR